MVYNLFRTERTGPFPSARLLVDTIPHYPTIRQVYVARAYPAGVTGRHRQHRTYGYARGHTPWSERGTHAVIAYLNGAFLPQEDATVSIEDRGYQFADGIYEVILLRNGHYAFLDLHLDRLWRSAGGLEITLPFERDELKRLLADLVSRNRMDEAFLYMQVTRGTAPRGHSFPSPLPRPTVVMYLTPPHVNPEAQEHGMAVITHEDNRWLDPWIKTVALLPNILAREQAARRGAGEVVLVRDGTVTECSTSNVFAVRDGTLITHPATRLILNGITRQVVLACAQRLGLPVEERPFTVAELFTADEVFYTSTGAFVTPAIRVDGKPVGTGTPGPVTKQLSTAFMQALREDVHETAPV